MSEVGPIQLEFDRMFEDYREAFIAQQRSLQSSSGRHGRVGWVLVALIVALLPLLCNFRMRWPTMASPAPARKSTTLPFLAAPGWLLRSLSRAFPVMPITGATES